MTPVSAVGGTLASIEIPIDGMKKARADMSKASLKIAGGEIEPEAFVELLSAQYTFAANAQVLKVMDETIGTVLDTVA